MEYFVVELYWVIGVYSGESDLTVPPRDLLKEGIKLNMPLTI